MRLNTTSLHIYILTILLIISGLTSAQNYVFYIQLKDKKNSPFAVENPSEYLSNRSIQRRLEQQIAIDSTDLPVNPDYITAILAEGVEYHSSSKWLNGIIAYTPDSSRMNTIRNLAFVDFAEYTGVMYENPFPVRKSTKFQMEEYRDYGTAYAQTNQLKVQALHEAGCTGKDIWIAVLDAGFDNVDQNRAFDSLRIQNRLLEARNMVLPHMSVYTEHYHGSNVLSTIAANLPGEYLGIAPHASYLLLQTEYNYGEYPFESDFWVIGLEYADSVGVDVVNSSLGYSQFDDIKLNYSYADMDGQTIRSSRAAYMASRKGILVCSSAGNEGSTTWRNITAPADAQGIITVGAVNTAGALAGFSSVGPSADNRVKPDVCATGWSTALVNRSGVLINSNGTSYSSPIMAGAMACYLQYCKQNLPFAYSVDMIINNVRASADRAELPDNEYGYGIPDFQKVLLLTAYQNTSEEKSIIADIYLDARTKRLIISSFDMNEPVELILINSVGNILASYSINQNKASINLDFLSPGLYIVHAKRKNARQNVKILIP